MVIFVLILSVALSVISFIQRRKYTGTNDSSTRSRNIWGIVMRVGIYHFVMLIALWYIFSFSVANDLVLNWFYWLGVILCIVIYVLASFNTEPPIGLFQKIDKTLLTILILLIFVSAAVKGGVRIYNQHKAKQTTTQPAAVTASSQMWELDSTKTPQNMNWVAHNIFTVNLTPGQVCSTGVIIPRHSSWITEILIGDHYQMNAAGDQVISVERQPWNSEDTWGELVYSSNTNVSLKVFLGM